MARTNIKLNISRKILAVVKKTKTKAKKNNIAVLRAVLIIIIEEIQQVITDYNNGTLERYDGDFNKRLMHHEKYDRNMPLIDSHELFDSIKSKRKYGTNNIIGRVFSTKKYYKDLDEGINKVVKYRITQIALERAKPKIKEVMDKYGRL